MAGEVDLLPLRPCTHVLGVDQANGGRAGLLSVATLAARSAAAMHTQREMDRLAALGIATKPTLLLDGTTESFYCDGPGGAVVSSDLRELLAARGGSFTRPLSPASYLGQAGRLLTAPADTPRIEYDSAGARRGLRMEGASTNLAFGATNNNSETFGGGVGMLSYSKSYAAPDGTNNATLITESTANSEHYVADMAVPATVGETYVWSAYVKEAPLGAKRCFYIRTATAAGANSTFDAGAGTWLGAGAGYVSRGFEQLLNGWWRVWMCVTATAAGSLIARMHLHDGVTPVYAGDGVSGLIVWGRQLEKVTAVRGPLSYIPALTAVTTRAADSCYLNTAGWLNDAEGTLAVDYTMDGADDVLSFALMRASGSLTGGSIYQQTNSNVTTQSYKDGAAQGGHNLGARVVGQRNRLAVSFKTGAFKAVRDGGAVATRTNFVMPTDLAQMWIGNRNGLGNPLYGWVHGLKYFPTALSDAQLQALTA